MSRLSVGRKDETDDQRRQSLTGGEELDRRRTPRVVDSQPGGHDNIISTAAAHAHAVDVLP